MECICGDDLGEPEFGEWLAWEECPNCDRRIYQVEAEKKRISERAALLRVVRAAEKYRWGRPSEELWNELYEALEALPDHLRGE